jgi:uncharacterized delta-60 repeat protein
MLEPLEDRCVPTAGLPDTTFGGTGQVTSNIVVADGARTAVAVYPDSGPNAGKVVAVGGALVISQQGKNTVQSDDFAVLRYNADGSLDTTFGPAHTGLVTTAIGTGTASDDASAVQLVGDKILVGGYSLFSNGSQGYALARYNTDGSLDTTFGSQGTVFSKAAGGLGVGMAFDPSSNTIVMTGSDGKGGVAVVRFTANGALDTTFGKGGVVTTSLADPTFTAGPPYGFQLAITPAGLPDAGKIVVLGIEQPNAQTGIRNNFVARYTTGGQLDPSFGNNGLLYLQDSDWIGHYDFWPAVVIQPSDGRIVLTWGSHDVHLFRPMPDGSFDPSFGSNGQVTTDRLGDQVAQGVALQPDGKIVVAGTERVNTSFWQFFVARYLSSGALDTTTFGSAGFGQGPVADLHGDKVGLALEDNGRLVVASNTSSAGFAVARFTGDAAVPAAAAAARPVSPALHPAALSPLVNEAVAGSQAAGVDPSAPAGIDVRAADQGNPFGPENGEAGVVEEPPTAGTPRLPGAAALAYDPALLDKAFAGGQVVAEGSWGWEGDLVAALLSLKKKRDSGMALPG